MTNKTPRLRTILSSGLLFLIDERTFMLYKNLIFRIWYINFFELFEPYLRSYLTLNAPYLLPKPLCGANASFPLYTQAPQHRLPYYYLLFNFILH